MDPHSPVHWKNGYGTINADGNAHLILGDVYQHPAALTKEQKEQRCCQTFKTSSYEYHKDRNPSRVAETCRWVLDHQRFHAWRSSRQNSLLWISADPGCGKSVLFKSLVDDGLCGGDLSTVCYFFFKDNDEQDNLATALCALLHQLFSLQPHLLRHAMPAWEKNGNELREETQEMWRILRASAMDRDAGPIICVLDALDECKDTDRRQLIQLLCDLQQSTQDGHPTGVLKVLVTSRPYDNVERWFKEATSRWPHVRLRGEDENDRIHQEIDLVIKQRMQDLTSEFSLAYDVRERLERQLLNMRNRTYLWLHLAMEEVREICRDSIYPDDIQIISLPTSVEDAYERILCKIKERQRTLARHILLIIVGARRPLSVQEMALALGATRASEQNASSLACVEPARLEQQVREQCGLFVFINHSQLFLIHQTAKEFLIAQSPSLEYNLSLWKSCLQEDQIEHGMTNICVTFLHLFDSEHFKREKFWQYCAEYWTLHLKDDFMRRDDYLLSKVLSLFMTDGALFSKWFPIMWKAISPYTSVPHVFGLHAIAITGHTFALQKRLENNNDHMAVDIKDGTGRTALHWAASCGHEKMVQLLLDQGADVKGPGGYYGTAVQVATAKGYEKMVELLLDRGADINDQGPWGNPLQTASFWGHERTVILILDRGADINVQGPRGNALQTALYKPHAKIVQLLLDRGADINALGPHGNALQTASYWGHDETVQLILKRGADINLEGPYGNAIQAASSKGHEKVVQLLLSWGADLNVQGPHGNALQTASYGGSGKIVQLILERGADIDGPGPHGTALQIASSKGYEKVVQLLLNCGADMNAQGESLGTALEQATAGGHHKVVLLLLARGAGLNVLGGDCGGTSHVHRNQWQVLQQTPEVVCDTILSREATEVTEVTDAGETGEARNARRARRVRRRLGLPLSALFRLDTPTQSAHRQTITTTEIPKCYAIEPSSLLSPPPSHLHDSLFTTYSLLSRTTTPSTDVPAAPFSTKIKKQATTSTRTRVRPRPITPPYRRFNNDNTTAKKPSMV